MGRTLLTVILATALLVAAAVAVAGGDPQSGGGSLPAEPQIVKGKIAFVERLGGYIIQGVDPVGEMMIVNPNPAVLQPLAKSAQVVRIQGRFTIGADHFRIETIDGKPYRAAAKVP